VLITYLFLKRVAGAPAGVLGAVLTLFSPRLFAHSLLATYDVPMVLWWMAATFAFYLGMDSRRWAAASGVLFGFALLTKINGFLLPLALWPWGLLFFGKKSIRPIVWQALLGPAMFFAGWPWLWLHPIGNTLNYFAEKLAIGAMPGAAAGAAWRRVIPTLYFGSASPSGVPWHYPFVMTLFTMPLATILGLVLSALRAKREPPSRPLAALFAWSVLVQLLIFAFAMKPYDGVRLFAPMLALTASLAALGLSWFATRGWTALVAVALIAVLSPIAEFFVYQPYGMSYYSPVAGGLPGAHALGMEVTYFGEAITPAQLAAINRLARDGQTVAYAPMFKRLPWRMPVELMRYGYLSPALRPVAPTDRWDYLLFVNRGGEIDACDRENLARSEALAENRLLGVLLSGAYRRREGISPEATDAPGHD
jgi:4-amino-4-deoxy-L-arabinose transferase-like glycosyltransferase